LHIILYEITLLNAQTAADTLTFSTDTIYEETVVLCAQIFVVR